METDEEGPRRDVQSRTEHPAVDIRGIRTARTERGIPVGMLDFYQAVDELAIPLPGDILSGLSEEQAERVCIMAENGVPMEEVQRYIQSIMQS
jgi:hypothetical protein